MALRASKRIIVGLLWSLAAMGCMQRKLAPLQPCLIATVADRIETQRIDKVDLLFMVDNSESMREEQAALRREFPALIRVLTTGDRDNDGKQDFAPATDLHLAVVSSNLGLPDLGTLVPRCEGFGDDGKFNSMPGQGLSGCESTYPAFLSYRALVDAPAKIANDFACIATLGTDGCGYEHQLEATLKALWPSAKANPATDPMFLTDENGFGGLGQGDQANRGFIRSPEEGLSVVAVVVVSDEDDCSAWTDEIFVPRDYLPDGSPYRSQDENQRCFLNKDKLYEPSRYVKYLRALRPGHEELVVFAGIVGVPPDLVDSNALSKVDLKRADQRDAFYRGILADPRMQEALVPSSDGRMPATLRPSCGDPSALGQQAGVAGQGKAYPPIRIVNVAQGFGENGIVQSICQSDFTPAMQAIIDLIAKHLGGVCLPAPLVRNSQGIVPCEVYWELPVATTPGASELTDCAQLPFLEAVGPKPGASSDRVRCRVKQLPVNGDPSGVGAGDGWYYDDFTPARLQQCASNRPQRVAFTEGSAPRNGVAVSLECLDQRQSMPDTRSDADPLQHAPAPGDACKPSRRDGVEHSADAACEVVLAARTPAARDGIDRSMFCHPEQNVCVRACTTSSDCPPAFTCDNRSETLASTVAPNRPNGSGYCLNPTCGSAD